jgi:hypothetical protein
VDWFFDLLGHVSTGCLFVVLLTFVGTLGIVGIAFWRALIKQHLVMGFVHKPIAERGARFESGYFRVVEAGQGLQNIADAALSTLEGSP